MKISPRIAEQIEKLPPELKALLDAEFAAGNEVYSIEFGRREDAGKVALILNHPFRTKPADAPAGVKYREMRDQDPEVFEFHLDGSLFTIITAKFKPMKLEPLPPGPESPNEKHAEFMKKFEKQEQEWAKKALQVQTEASTMTPAAKERAASAVPTTPNPSWGEAANKFVASMTMTFDMWHDGLSYELDALRQCSEAERKSIEAILIRHHPRDWRDIEALAQFDSPAARKIVEAAVHSSDPQVRQTAMSYAADHVDPAKREALLIKSLENDVIFGGLSQSIDEVEEFHPPGVIDALFRGALNRDGEAAVHFAAMLFFLHGKAKEPFDWDHRRFFLKFHATDRKERVAVFRELCAAIGVDTGKYVR